METFTLPELAPWLSQVLYCAPFSYQRSGMDSENSDTHHLPSANASTSASASASGVFASPAAVSDNASGGSSHRRVTKKMHLQDPRSLSHGAPTGHALAILGVFASAGKCREGVFLIFLIWFDLV